MAMKTDVNDTRDEILPNAFTDEAITSIGDVPMYQIEFPGFGGALSVGNDWGSRAVSAIGGYGNERQVLMNVFFLPQSNSYQLIVVHEYVHQADYEGLISRDLFRKRIFRMIADPAYEEESEAFLEFLADLAGNGLYGVTLLYDNGVLREGMAYLIEAWVDGCIELPDYVLEVYEDAIRFDSPYRMDTLRSCDFSTNKFFGPIHCRTCL